MNGGVSNTIRLNSNNLMPLIGLGTSKDDPIKVQSATYEALRVGYRLIDTAFFYRNEKHIGQAIKSAIEDGIVTREDVFVVTKLPTYGHLRADVSKYLKHQLETLQLEYIDLYLVHMPTPYKPLEYPSGLFNEGESEASDTEHTETWKGMEDCVDMGLAKSIGLSNFNSEQLLNIYNSCRIKPTVLQVECHVYLQQDKLLQICKECDVVLMAYAPLGSPALKSFYEKVFKREMAQQHSEVLKDEVLKKIAANVEKTSAQVALRFLIQRGICIIPKSVNFDRIQQNFQITDFSLSSDDMKLIQQLNKNERFFAYEEFPLIINHKFYPFREEIDF